MYVASPLVCWSKDLGPSQQKHYPDNLKGVILTSLSQFPEPYNGNNITSRTSREDYIR